MDEDGSGGELLYTRGEAGVRDGGWLGVRVHTIQLQHGHKVSRGVLLDGSRNELKENPHQLVSSSFELLLCNDISQFSDDMRKRDKLKQNRGKMNIPNYNSISKPGIGQSI